MASFNKFNQFVQDVASGVHQLQTGTSHVLKVMLTNTLPVAANSILSDITEISTGNGYSAGGTTVGTITGSQTSGTFKLVGGTDPVFTASGAVGPFRYAVLYNSTPSSPLKPLIGWWDYGSSISLANGETFTVDIDQTNGILTLA
ncbi:MAG: hypothetical protein EBR82_53920 [Caulobacteraceae bacterium]|nr:hypothetical protein [Caulobacteraceae bacterium]